MRYSLSIDYWGESVMCFDPQKVVVRFCNWFAGTVVDHTDHAAREVDNLESYLVSNNTRPEVAQAMLRQIRGKQQRNGPVFKFSKRLETGIILTGSAARYSVRIECDCEPDEVSRTKLVEFLESLGAGTLEIVGK